MTVGHCSHCRQQTTVWRYRMAEVGLRYLCCPCFAALSALGMAIVPVTDADPRTLDLGPEARIRPGIGRRIALRARRWAAAA